MDVSTSMNDEGAALCANITQVAADLQAEEDLDREVERLLAAERLAGPVHDVRVDHGCFDILMAEKLLDRSDVRTRLQ